MSAETLGRVISVCPRKSSVQTSLECISAESSFMYVSGYHEKILNRRSIFSPVDTLSGKFAFPAFYHDPIPEVNGNPWILKFWCPEHVDWFFLCGVFFSKKTKTHCSNQGLFYLKRKLTKPVVIVCSKSPRENITHIVWKVQKMHNKNCLLKVEFWLNTPLNVSKNASWFLKTTRQQNMLQLILKFCKLRDA